MYQIPPSATHAGHRADSWNVEKWLRAVRVKVTTRGSKGAIKLEDKDSGELFAECPLPNDAPVSTAVEPVIDSSRYFVLRVVDDASGRHAFLGLGFRERDHASDFKLAVQEHQNARSREREALKRREEHERLIAEKAAANAAAGVEGPAKLHDYSLKGTVTVNIPSRRTTGAKSVNAAATVTTTVTTTTASAGDAGGVDDGGFGAFGLPPPPAAATPAGGFAIPPPPAVSQTSPVGTDAPAIIRSPTAGTGLNSGGWTAPVAGGSGGTGGTAGSARGEGWANFDEPARGDEDWADFQS